MKRITIVLKASEVTTVRKAVCAAGGNLIVITPVSRRNNIELADWNCGLPISTPDNQVRLDVTVDNTHSDHVISAIISTAHVGKIETISLLPAKANRTPLTALRHAA